MAQIASPYGLRVLKTWGEQYFTGGMHEYPILTATQNATSIFFGDPVGLQGGSVVPLTATPVAGVPGVVGIFQGASWQDPVRGFVNSQMLPAGIITGGATNVKVKVVNNPFVVMRVQADGSVPLGKTGFAANLGNFGAGSVFDGNSAINLASASLTPGTSGSVQIYGYVIDAGPSPGAGSLPGDPYTDLLVIWNFGVHRFLNATGG